MTTQEVALDLQRAIKRAAGATALSTKPELVNNVYPLMMGILEAVEERLQGIEGVVAEIVDATESMVQPELREQLDVTFTTGLALCEMLGSLKLDDVAAKKANDLIQTYRKAVDAAVTALDDAAMEEDPEDDGEDEEDGEGEEGEEGDEEDDEDEEEIAAKDDK